MLTYRLERGAGAAALQRLDTGAPAPAGREVRVRIRAASLNYRDLMIARGDYLGGAGGHVTPGSDGAGDVVAVGPQATRFRVGDRVVASFYPDWIDGEPTPAKHASALGGGGAGVFAQEIVLHEDALAAIPDALDYAAAATLPCAGVTAWHALFVAAASEPGDTVLLQGTGGVSIFGLQLAKAAGLNAIVTSSDDAKLARARALGADATINYRTTPAWDEEVLRLTGGRGADLVFEIGGRDTLQRSIAATRMRGTIAVIGGVSGFGGALEPFALITGLQRLVGVRVGSRAMLEALARFVASHRIAPVIDRRFAFDELAAAYAHLEAAHHFGKIVVDVGEAQSAAIAA
ncbi:MAG TPA: NAD(P)-dependent alcohol dehydrogenase [Xanthomonadales bacterium]|nr:NAD(P)-dependent alcohol dehydrogenase [Xanthomonadales bacterium]